MPRIFSIGSLNAISVYCAWAMLLIGGFYFVYALATEGGSSSTLIRLFYGFFAFVLVHFILAFFVRCPHCERCLTIQTFKQPHSASSGNWASVVGNWFSGSVVCIHCGNGVDTKNL